MDLVRLRREAAALAQLAHPNVVAVYDLGRYGSTTAGPHDPTSTGAFLVMELVEGEDLSHWLRAPHSAEEILATFVGAGRGLAAAHAEGIVHRDFKPANVVVRDDGIAKVLDFGLARRGGRDSSVDEPVSDDERDVEASLLDTPLTQTGVVMGTPLYMAPEQHRGRPTDPRSDQYSFCLALAEALHGERIVAGKTFSELLRSKLELRLSPDAHRIAPTLCRALSRGLSVDPADRHPSMEVLLDALTPTRRGWLGVTLVAAVAVAGAVVLARPDERPASPTVDVLDGEALAEAMAYERAYIDGLGTAAKLISRTAGEGALRDFARRLRVRALAEDDPVLSAWSWYWEAESWDSVQEAATAASALTTAFYEAQAADVPFVAAHAASGMAFAMSALGDPGWETWVRHTLSVVERGELSPRDSGSIVADTALAYAAVGDMEQAAVMLQDAVDTIVAEAGWDAEALEWPVSNLTGALWGSGRFDEAIVWAERSMALRRAIHEPMAGEVGISKLTLGLILLDAGAPIEAVAPLLEARAIFAASESTEQECGAMNELARAMAGMDRLPEAIALQSEALELFAKVPGDYKHTFAQGALALARWSQQLGRVADARKAYRSVLDLHDGSELVAELQQQARAELVALPGG